LLFGLDDHVSGAELSAIMDLGGWLRSLGLEMHEATFRKNEIDETVLPSLTAEDLKDLGVSIVGPPSQTAGRDCGSPKRYKRCGVSC
jgi:hypothetical protein